MKMKESEESESESVISLWGGLGGVSDEEDVWEGWPPSNKGGQAGAAEKVAKIIDGKKSQNLGIFLRSKKIDAEIVRQILFECDTSWESESLLALQGYNAHPEEELPMLLDHIKTKPEVPLDMPDQFLYNLSKIHMLDHRLTCLLFMSSFSGVLEDVATRLDSLSKLLERRKQAEGSGGRIQHWYLVKVEGCQNKRKLQ